MRVDRGEAQGTGLALLLHVGLVVALTTSLAHVPSTPEPPPMQVEVVDSEEVALTAEAPQPAAPAPAAQAPAPAEPTPPIPNEITPPPPTPAPTPPQSIARSNPPRQTTAPPKPAPPRPTSPRQTRLGNDFLKGLGDDLAPNPQPAKQGAATFSAAAKASVNEAIRRQIEPCAARQRALGTGAERIRVVLNLRLDRSGRLSRQPSLVRTSGVDDENRVFEDLALDQAVAVFRTCSPLRLPAELYSTPQGGWGNINFTYKAK